MAGTRDKTGKTRVVTTPCPLGLEMRNKECGDWGSAPPQLRGGTNCDGDKVSGRRYKGATREGAVCAGVTRSGGRGRAEATRRR